MKYQASTPLTLIYSTLHSTRAPTLSPIILHSTLFYATVFDSTLLFSTLLYSILASFKHAHRRPSFQISACFFRLQHNSAPDCAMTAKDFFLAFKKKWLPNIAPNFTFPTKKTVSLQQATIFYRDFPGGLRVGVFNDPQTSGARRQKSEPSESSKPSSVTW